MPISYFYTHTQIYFSDGVPPPPPPPPPPLALPLPTLLADFPPLEFVPPNPIPELVLGVPRSPTGSFLLVVCLCIALITLGPLTAPPETSKENRDVRIATGAGVGVGSGIGNATEHCRMENKDSNTVSKDNGDIAFLFFSLLSIFSRFSFYREVFTAQARDGLPNERVNELL